jgi:hypothetical protein
MGNDWPLTPDENSDADWYQWELDQIREAKASDEELLWWPVG